MKKNKSNFKKAEGKKKEKKIKTNYTKLNRRKIPKPPLLRKKNKEKHYRQSHAMSKYGIFHVELFLFTDFFFPPQHLQYEIVIFSLIKPSWTAPYGFIAVRCEIIPCKKLIISTSVDMNGSTEGSPHHVNYPFLIKM